MKCPICANKEQVEVNLHADGFAKNLQECGGCGAVWVNKRDGATVINNAVDSEQ